MILWDEIYFDITLNGTKAELKKFISFLRSGDLEDFFEMSSDYIILDDSYTSAEDDEETEIVFTNDDYGIEIEEFDTGEFLEMFCRAAKRLTVYGNISDADGNEFNFISDEGDSYYINSRKAAMYDELDHIAIEEEPDDD